MASTETKYRNALRAIQDKVDMQSNDPFLWELYGFRTELELQLQRELRDLHDVIERYTIEFFERMKLIETSEPEPA